jgi:hypothetical protein
LAVSRHLARHIVTPIAKERMSLGKTSPARTSRTG